MKIALPMFSDSKTTAINSAYIKYIIAAGMTPIPVFVDENINDKMKMCDGLLLPGGIDIDPTYYGYNNIGSYNVSPERDIFERMLLHTFISIGKPVFGICRGLQLVARELVCNATTDITFCQHINGHNQNDTNSRRDIKYHNVDCNNEYLRSDNATNHGVMFVNSFHHQAVCLNKNRVDSSIIHTDTGDIIITATTGYGAPDAYACVIEGILLPHINVSAVQWHPEELMDVSLLVNAFNSQDKQNVYAK